MRPRTAIAAFVLAALLQVFAIGCSFSIVIPGTGTSPSPAEELETATPVSLETSDGATLRGVHVRSGAPEPSLILHLLPAGVAVEGGASIDFMHTGLAPTLEDFAEAGYDSLVFDHRGVGGSDQPGSPEALIADGGAMWREALKLVDGRPDRIVVRAGSLGTLIAAELLARGAKPMAVVLYAPVRSKTVVAHAARRYSGFIGVLMAPFLVDPPATDLAEVLPKTKVPVLVMLDRESEYLPDSERNLVAAAARQGGHTVVATSLDHNLLVMRCWGFEVTQTEGGGFSARNGARPLPEEIEWLDAIRAGEGR